MTRLVILVGSVTSLTQFQSMDGEAMGRLVLQLVGLFLSAFMFYVAFREVGGRFS